MIAALLLVTCSAPYDVDKDLSKGSTAFSGNGNGSGNGNDDGGDNGGGDSNGGDNGGSSGGNSGGGSGGGSSYEAPDIGFYDYTAYTTSLKVEFQIFNPKEANVSRATVYYGTSSPSRSAGATVSGRMITARISGLKKGTIYYVKCVASGPGGSTTSETVRCMTND